MRNHGLLTNILTNAFALYRAANPIRLTATTSLPRAAMQVVFFTLISLPMSPLANTSYAFIGSVVIAILLSTLVQVTEVPSEEKWQGTFYRLRGSLVSPVGILYLRGIPYALEGFVLCLLSIVLAGAITGNLSLIPTLLACAPILLLISLTSVATGLALSSTVLGKRADVVVANGFLYLTVAAAELVSPTEWPALAAVGSFLPATHGVAGMRSILAGESSWILSVVAEAGVGLLWLVIGLALFNRQVRAAGRSGSDDFA